MHLLVPRLQRQELARPGGSLRVLIAFDAVSCQARQCFSGQVIHLLGRHHEPFLELGAAWEREARQKGTLPQRQRGLARRWRRRLHVVQKGGEVDQVDRSVAGQVELERRRRDEQKGRLGGGVGNGLAQAGQGMAQVSQRGAGW